VSEGVSPSFIKLAREILKSRPVICDIGSRDAREGLSLLHQLNASCLHIFEPNPAAAEICRRNIPQNTGQADCPQVLFNELAVSDQTSRVKFYPLNPALSENKDIGFSSLFQVNPDYSRRRGKVVQDEVVVNAITLDEYFADKQHPDLLWVDVEGAELQVLRGARSILPGVRLLHVEVSFRPMQIGKPLFWEVQRYLHDFGFVFYGFPEISALKSFLYRRRWLPNPPWRLDAVFCNSIES
jgi:FkbM family methyltransferase